MTFMVPLRPIILYKCVERSSGCKQKGEPMDRTSTAALALVTVTLCAFFPITLSSLLDVDRMHLYQLDLRHILSTLIYRNKE